MVVAQRHRMILLAILVITFFYFVTPHSSNQLEQIVYDLGRVRLSTTDDSAPVFTDRTLEAGLLTPHSQKSDVITGIHESLGAGVCTLDINMDGWLDIVTLNGAGITHYFGKTKWWQKPISSVSVYLNNRDGTFSDITSKSDFPTNNHSMGCAIGDLDNDGDQDLYLTNKGPNQLWVNEGGGKFANSENVEIGQSASWSTGATIADFNQDGWLDIYTVKFLAFISNSLTFENSAGFEGAGEANFDTTLHSGQANQLLINQGGMVFQDETSVRATLNSQGRGLAAFATDVDGNGMLDVLVANGANSENKFFLNSETSFIDASVSSSLGILSTTSSVIAEDFNLDGNQDLLVSTGNEQFTKLFERDSATQEVSFIDVSDLWHLNTETKVNTVGWAPAIADFNMDGWSDVLVVNGSLMPNIDSKNLPQGQPAYLLFNQRGRSFQRNRSDLTNATMEVNSARCAVSGDFNNDGAADALIAVNNGLPRLLVNSVDANRWLGLVLDVPFMVGDPKVKVQTNKRLIERAIGDGSRGQCWQDNRHFSIPLQADEHIRFVSITTRDEVTRKYDNLELNTYNVISASEGVVDKPANRETRRTTEAVVTSPEAKLKLAKWLMNENKNQYALNELVSIINSGGASQRKSAIGLLSKLPRGEIIRAIPPMLRHNDLAVKRAGISLIRATEDDRLARWLFRLVNHQSMAVACDAMHVLEHFFREEEAMVLSKYSDLDSLLKIASTDEPQRKVCAISALGEAERFRAVRPLIDNLDDKSEKVRAAAISALGRIRERSAVPYLRKHYRSTDTSYNKLLVLQSLQLINEEFDIYEFIRGELESAEQSSPLSAFAELFVQSKSDPFLSLNKRRLSELVLDWHRQKSPALSDSDRANYYLIVNSIQPVDTQKWVNLLASDSEPESAMANRMLLARSTGKEKLRYLAMYLKQGENIVNVPTLNLSAAEVQSVLNDTPKLNRSAAVKKLLPYMGQSAQRSLLKQIILSPNWGGQEKQIVQTLLAERATNDASNYCDEFFEMLNLHKTHLDTFELLRQKWGYEMVSSCYIGQNFKEAPRAINNALSSGTELRKIAIPFICQRKERWARNNVIGFLSSTTVPDEEKVLCINNLPNKPLSSQVKLLQKLYDAGSNTSVKAASAVKLSESPGWTDKNKDSLMENIAGALSANDDVFAVQFADLLMDKHAKSALALFFSDEI